MFKNQDLSNGRETECTASVSSRCSNLAPKIFKFRATNCAKDSMAELSQQLARSSQLNHHRNIKEMLKSAMENKTQLYTFFQTIQTQGWASFTKWSKQGGKSADQLLLLSVI